MINKNFYIAAVAAVAFGAKADTMKISEFFCSEPLPVAVTSLKADGVLPQGVISPLDRVMMPESGRSRTITLNSAFLKADKDSAVRAISADFENRYFVRADIKVSGLGDHKVLLDGKALDSGTSVKLLPGTHNITIKYMTPVDTDADPSVEISTDEDGALAPVADGSHMYSLADVLYGTRISSASVSPDGAYILADYTDTKADGSKLTYQRLFSAKTGKPVRRFSERVAWMPSSPALWAVRSEYEPGRHIVKIDPISGAETVLAENIPDGDFRIAPTEDFLVYRMVREGHKEDPDVYRVIEPEDRQPGWRDRSYPAVYYFSNPRALRPVAADMGNVEVLDMSADGKKLLLMTSERFKTERPTTRFSLIDFDLATMTADTIVDRDGFIQAAFYSPEAKKVVVTGSPEAFGRVGCVLPADKVPSMYDNQLFIVDVASKAVTPLTREFDPSVNGALWSKADNKIYLTATDKDKYTIYSIDPASGAIAQVPAAESAVAGVAAANNAPVLAWWGQSESAPDALYALDPKSGRSTMLDRPSSHRFENIRLGECKEWSCTTSRGDEVIGVYFLPDNFDPSKKYPLIVNYYGGCTPCTRSLESRYPLHVYASLGYVVLQLQPSGCAGFGQEWASRHVSTAGKGVAEDIIEATKTFCKEMPFVNADKIGCIGASYGGFMTMFLQTQTPLFAAAISHAGISDHTSYWGEGYWGYSYSETAMGADLPWSERELYVGQSPLYNADKVHTPILFLHGDADHNVPVGESIQMFTALQRLGRESAMVLVKDQDHHILDFSKRQKWQNTIFAWFAKYLQDNPQWWDEMYPTAGLE